MPVLNSAYMQLQVTHSLYVLQFLIILCMVGLDVGIQTGPGQPNNKPLIIVNSVGLIVMAVWSWLAYRAVKHEDRVLAWVLTVLLPIMYILPIVDIVLGMVVPSSCLYMHSGKWTAAHAYLDSLRLKFRSCHTRTLC